jgi:hypothetical protein
MTTSSPPPRLPEADELGPEPAGIPGEGTSCRAAFRALGSWRGSMRILQKDLAETEVAWGRAGRRARTIRIPRARWCMTAEPGGSAAASRSGP